MNLPDEKNIKQGAVQHLSAAVRLGNAAVMSMYYDSGRDGVLIGFRNGSLWVNTAGDSVIAMLGDVMDAVKRHT